MCLHAWLGGTALLSTAGCVVVGRVAVGDFVLCLAQYLVYKRHCVLFHEKRVGSRLGDVEKLELVASALPFQ